MVQFVLVGVCAGATAALMFAPGASGSPMAIMLAQLAPLPILISGLGWGHWTALLAAISSALALATFHTGFFFLVFLFGVALPAWWLSYLTLLARPGANGPGATGRGANGPGSLEWYPVGRLVIWACVLGTIVTAAVVIMLASTDAGYETALKAGFEHFLRRQNGVPEGGPLVLPGVSDPDRLLDLLVLLIPPGTAAFASMTKVLNLWLAGRVVHMSGRLVRPWTDFAELRLPRIAAVVFIAALAGSALPDLAGVLCRLLAASLLFAYVLLGFAVLHALTRPLRNRSFVLASAYTAAVLLQWPTLIMLLIGLADAAIDLRARLSARSGPPQLPSP